MDQWGLPGSCTRHTIPPAWISALTLTIYTGFLKQCFSHLLITSSASCAMSIWRSSLGVVIAMVLPVAALFIGLVPILAVNAFGGWTDWVSLKDISAIFTYSRFNH